jgi:uncharacterized membrane protein
MNAVETLSFFHILLAFVFFSGTIVAAVASAWAAREQNVHTIRTLTNMAKMVSLIMIYPAIIALGIIGVFLAQEQDLSLTDTGWLNAAYAATALGLLLGLFVMGRQSMRAARLAERDAAAGQKSAELQAVLSERLPKIVGGALHGLVVYILVLMVFKPF